MFAAYVPQVPEEEPRMAQETEWVPEQAGSGGGRQQALPPMQFSPMDSLQCRSDLSAVASPPHCIVKIMPLVDKEFLLTNWWMDAPEPPTIIGLYDNEIDIDTPFRRRGCRHWR